MCEERIQKSQFHICYLTVLYGLKNDLLQLYVWFHVREPHFINHVARKRKRRNNKDQGAKNSREIAHCHKIRYLQHPAEITGAA